MKKQILIIMFCAFLSNNLFAQVKQDYSYYNHQIDSLSSYYSFDQFNSFDQFKNIRAISFYFDNSILSTDEKKKLIDKIEKMFRQKDYVNLYLLGHSVIDGMWWMWPNNNSLEIKQKLMEVYLQYYFYPGISRIVEIYVSNDRVYYSLNSDVYSNKAKERIKEILEGKKTQEEFNIRLQYEKSLPIAYISRSWEDASRILKERGIQNDTILKQIRDSLLTNSVYQETKKDFESLQIEPNLIKMIGLLGMKECIPVLKQNLQLCIQNKCLEEQIKAYRYALTRLGDKEQRRYILENLMDDEDFNQLDFLYFQDDGMIWHYIEVNYRSNKKFFPFSHGEGITLELKTMSSVYPLVKNIPEELKYPELSNDMNEIYKWEKSLYKWLIANKATVQFDYNGEKKFPW